MSDEVTLADLLRVLERIEEQLKEINGFLEGIQFDENGSLRVRQTEAT